MSHFNTEMRVSHGPRQKKGGKNRWGAWSYDNQGVIAGLFGKDHVDAFLAVAGCFGGQFNFVQVFQHDLLIN